MDGYGFWSRSESTAKIAVIAKDCQKSERQILRLRGSAASLRISPPGSRSALPRSRLKAAQLEFWFGRCFQQRTRVFVLWSRGDFFGWADLDDFSATHNGDAVAQIADHPHGVRAEAV